MPRPKKVGALPVKGRDERKQTNEIGMAMPLLATCDIAGCDITGDALLTQRTLAAYIVGRGAHYHFSAKGNQPGLMHDISLHFEHRGAPDFAEQQTLAHGRIEVRRIWCTTALNDYLDFPHVGQCFVVERETIIKKTGEHSSVFVYGLTSRTPQQASPERVLQLNRRHWSIEAVHYIIDWNYDEDRSRIRTGHGPENVTRLRRFAVGVLNRLRKPNQSIAQMMRQLCFRPRTVLDYLRLTANSGQTVGAGG